MSDSSAVSQSLWKGMFSFLQKIGKSLMLPVSILPVAGLLLGIGGALLSGVDRGAINIDSLALLTLFSILKESGGPIFDNLPIIFAVGTVLGLTKNDGAAALAAIVGYVVMLGTMGVVGTAFEVSTSTIMGIHTIDTGVFGGILVGCVAAGLFNRFFRIELPAYLGFFAGKRFVPIITALAAICLGIFLSIVWPPIQHGIDTFSNRAITGDMGVTVFTYGFVERLLVPFGLHHIWNVPFFFEIGQYVTASGDVVQGEITRFFNGDPSAGNLGGGYLFKMFGLPAAALAIWQCADQKNKIKTGGIMISAALTSFLTGITEPIEFSFLFVAPALYGLHAFFAGLSFLVVYSLGAKLGFTFSHGFIDYALFFAMDTKPWVVMLAGPCYFALYYVSFKVIILQFNLKTPGRDKEESINEASSIAAGEQSQAAGVLAALGGAQNIENLDACITRLRVGVHHIDMVDEEKLKSLGASGVIKIGDNLQAIFGTLSEILKGDILELIENHSSPAEKLDKNEIRPKKTENFSATSESDAKDVDPQISQQTDQIIAFMGGKENIESIKPCALTRLRVVVNDENKINNQELIEQHLKTIRIKKGIYHILVGLNAHNYRPTLP